MRKIVLFQPEKPANTGNIIRLAMALDFALAIVGEPSFDLSEKALRRAAMDYALLLTIERYPTLEDFLQRHEGYRGHYVTRYAPRVYSDFDLSDHEVNQFYMFGKESTGLPKDFLKKHLDQTMRIPMAIDARSLNLADSVAIICSEVNRQQSYAGLSRTETIKGKDYLLH